MPDSSIQQNGVGMRDRLVAVAAKAAHLVERTFQTNGDVIGELAGDRMNSRVMAASYHLGAGLCESISFSSRYDCLCHSPSLNGRMVPSNGG